MNKRLQSILIAGARKLPMQPRRQCLYAIRQGRWPRLRNPQLMTEKVNWRILFDRRDLLKPTCDKLQMKSLAQSLCPHVEVPQTLWCGRDLNELVDLALPAAWVLKPNHRSGLVYFGSGQVEDVSELQSLTAGWLENTHVKRVGEWAYGFADQLLIVEEALGTRKDPPADYKFYVFDGVARLIQVDHARFGAEASRRHYTPTWDEIPLEVDVDQGPERPAPHRLAEMVEVAEQVGRPFDFMRIDLYLVGDRIYLGELTPYPASGFGRYKPREWDRIMGSYWTLPGI